jgi:hypothetical protein
MESKEKAKNHEAEVNHLFFSKIMPRFACLVPIEDEWVEKVVERFRKVQKRFEACLGYTTLSSYLCA